MFRENAAETSAERVEDMVRHNPCETQTKRIQRDVHCPVKTYGVRLVARMYKVSACMAPQLTLDAMILEFSSIGSSVSNLHCICSHNRMPSQLHLPALISP